MAIMTGDSETLLNLFGEHDLRPTRRAVRSLAQQLPFGPREVEDITLAVAEACMNGVRHGHSHPDFPLVTVEARPNGDHLFICVVDHGAGFRPGPAEMPGPRAESGRGLPLMHALMDRVEIHSDHEGTRVQLVKYFDR